MADAHTASAGAHGNRSGLLSWIKTIIVRFYALAILLVVLWTGYTAIAYLVRTVLRPVDVPQRLLDRRVELDPGVLHADKLRETAAAPRPPVGRYHEVGTWAHPDPMNGCVISGCHSSLPHARSKETRAFANFHATFLSCSMCHDADPTTPAAASWVDIRTGQRQDAPALLQLARLLEEQTAQVASQPADVHPRIVLLLTSINAVAKDPVLDYLLVQINTSEPGSPMWRHSVEQVRTSLANHMRGDYGAKLTPLDEAAGMQQRYRELVAAAERYMAADGPDRDRIQKEIHAKVLAKPEACLSCHSGEPRRLDYASLGYPPERIGAIESSPIAGMIQRMREGGTFQMPQMLEPGHAR